MILELFSVYFFTKASATACFDINAKVISFDEKTAVLQTYDGSRATLILEKLPEATRKFLKANVGHMVSDCFPIEARKSMTPGKTKTGPKSKGA